MERIFTLGNSVVVQQLGFSNNEIPNLINDCEIHNWIVSLFEKNEIEKLVIEIGDKPELSLKIALHIRLSLSELNAKSLIPILFVSHSSLNNIILETTVWSHLLATKGIYFSSIDSIEKIQTEVCAIEGISTNEYKTGFLNIIKILPDENIGRHSLANIWGVYAMDKTANTNALIDSVDFNKNKTKLYFKYVAAFNYDMSKLNPSLSSLKIVGKIYIGESNRIDSSNRKILLIDDEADKGWETVLRKIFKTSSADDFVVINEKAQDYENLSAESKNLIENTVFDLYLIDLRLNGIAEENIMDSKDFSGMKVMQKIKSLNQGNQVIIFTASNKVWNLKALLDEGADGYYMKESPEFGFSAEFSKQNYLRFQEDVRNCFERKYLRNIWNDFNAIANHFEKNKPLTKYFPNNLELLRALGYQNLIITEFDSIFSILKTSNTNKLNMAMISLFKILEFIAEIFINLEQNDILKFWDGSEVYICFDWAMNKYNPRPKTKDVKLYDYTSTRNKIHAILFQKLLLTNNSLHQSIDTLTKYRNDYIHPKDRFKLKELTSDSIKKWIENIRFIIEKL